MNVLNFAWNRYMTVLVDLRENQRFLFVLHIFFVSAAVLTLALVLLSWGWGIVR